MRYILIVLIIALAGCTDQKRLKDLEAQNNYLQTQNELLTEQTELKNSYIQDYTATVNEVYDYLERIRKREGLLMKYSKELEKDNDAALKERIHTNLSSIDQYLTNSKAEIRRLQSKMNESQIKMVTLEESVAKLTQFVEDKENQIQELKTKIDHLSEVVTVTENKLAESSRVVNQQTRELNKAFYIIGSDSELKEKHIIDKKGGILGLGKTTTLAAGLDESYFVQTDITTTDSILIDHSAGAIKIISPHNPDSYHLVGQENNRTTLEIIDPGEFWKMRYLVISAKN